MQREKSASGVVSTLLFIASVGFLLLGLVFIAYGVISNGAFAAVPLGIILMARAPVLSGPSCVAPRSDLSRSSH